MIKQKKTNLRNVICVRVSDRERDMLQLIAQQNGQKVSQLMRDCFSFSISSRHSMVNAGHTLGDFHDEVRA